MTGIPMAARRNKIPTESPIARTTADPLSTETKIVGF
jgi:hypothetical protein